MNSYKNIHPQFRLNGFRLTKDELCKATFDLIKEGSSYEKTIGLFISEWLDNSPEITLQTSGTTGKSKKITFQKQAMVDSALATGNFFELKPEDTALCCLPVNFIAGKMMLVRAFVLGLNLDIVEPDSCPLKNIGKKYSFCAMTPMQVKNSIGKLHFIEKLIIGGSKLNSDLEKKLVNLPVKSYETYASTETLTHIAARKIGDKNFKLLPDIAISTDQRGCLVIDAPRISNQKITTNDLVELKSEREFLWLGRFDNVINSGGIKLFPEKIEALLAEKIPYRFFIGGISDSSLGEKSVLVIESEKYELPPDVFNHLDKYEKPKEIIFVPEFFETETGKIKRNDVLKNIKID